MGGFDELENLCNVLCNFDWSYGFCFFLDIVSANMAVYIFFPLMDQGVELDMPDSVWCDLPR